MAVPDKLQDGLSENDRWAQLGKKYNTETTQIASLKEGYQGITAGFRFYDQATGFAVLSGVDESKKKAVVNEIWTNQEYEFWRQKGSYRENVNGAFTEPIIEYISLEVRERGSNLRVRYVVDTLEIAPLAQIQLFTCASGLARQSIIEEKRLAIMTYKNREYPTAFYMALNSEDSPDGLEKPERTLLLRFLSTKGGNLAPFVVFRPDNLGELNKERSKVAELHKKSGRENILLPLDVRYTPDHPSRFQFALSVNREEDKVMESLTMSRLRPFSGELDVSVTAPLLVKSTLMSKLQQDPSNCARIPNQYPVIVENI